MLLAQTNKIKLLSFFSN